MKKALSHILVIIMLLSVVPMTALSAAGAETDLAVTGGGDSWTAIVNATPPEMGGYVQVKYFYVLENHFHDNYEHPNYTYTWTVFDNKGNRFIVENESLKSRGITPQPGYQCKLTVKIYGLAFLTPTVQLTRSLGKDFTYSYLSHVDDIYAEISTKYKGKTVLIQSSDKDGANPGHVFVKDKNDYSKDTLTFTYDFPPSCYPVETVDLGVTAPVAGQPVDFSAVPNHPEQVIVSENSGNFSLHGVRWYDKTDNTTLSGGTFKEGHEYVVSVYVEPKEGYYITEDATATINGKAAKITKVEDDLYEITYPQEPDLYDLWIGSTQVTSENYNDILGDGKAKFNANNNTLTLNDPTITDSYEDFSVIYSELDNLTIKGKATINHPDITESICANNLTLSGDFIITADEAPVFVPDGSLTIEDSTLKLCSASGGTALDCEYGDLTVTDSSVTTVDSRIWVNGDVKTDNSTLNVDSYFGEYGIYAYGGINFLDSYVTVTGSMKYGVFASSGMLIINDSMVDAYGTEAAIANQNFLKTANYSAVYARGGKYGIMSTNKVDIASNTTWVEAWGSESAIKGYKGLTVGEGLAFTEPAGGKVNAAGTDIVNASGKSATYVKLEMPAPAAILGDVDGDGEVTIIDATAIQRRMAGMPTDLYSKDAADVDSDGDVSVLDVTLIQRYLASFSVSEPIGLTIT